MNKHDRGIEEIVKRLETDDFDDIRKFLVYGNKANPIGEMDVVAYYNGYALIFEFKSNDNYKLREHAIDQLHRASEYIKNYKKFLFYCYWDKNKIKYEVIK